MINPNDLHNTDLPSDLPWEDEPDAPGAPNPDPDWEPTISDMSHDTEYVYKDAKNATERPSYRQMCGVCYGTGNWKGRAGYKCFPCNGAGFVTFSTSPEKRARGRARAAERKIEKGDELLAQFEAQNPHFKAWWTDSTFGFAVSLREAVRKFGNLTENQRGAAERCIEKFEALKAEANIRVEQAPVVSIAALEACFEIAGNAGKKPRLRLAEFTFSRAPESGKNAGALYVKQGSTYLGKIHKGKLFRSMACDDATEDAIVAVASQPKESAIAYGRMSGCCAICNRRLDNPESIERGIGPVCAGNFGW